MTCKNFIIASVTFLIVGCTSRSGEPMPEFDLMLPDGTVFNTRDIPSGKPILTVYYDGQCKECREEVNDIVSRIDELEHIRFYLITIEPIENLTLFKNELKLEGYKNIIIAKDTAIFLPRYLKVRTTPYSVLWDKEKKMKGIFGNRADIDTLIKYSRKI